MVVVSLFDADTGCGPWSVFVEYATSLHGPWQPHVRIRLKPICAVRGRRETCLCHEGSTLHRPSQDYRDNYGGALCINRIDELNTERFRETPVRLVSPDPNGPYPDGLHTLTGNTWLIAWLTENVTPFRWGFYCAAI